MAFLNTNHTRFAYLLDWGTQDGEMKRFLKECQKRLIAKGAHLDNLPQTRATRIKAIKGLPQQTEPIIKEWFSKNITMIDPENVEDLIGEFQLYEEADERMPNERANRLARSTLVHLFSEKPPMALVSFLQSAIVEDPTSLTPDASENNQADAMGDAQNTEIKKSVGAQFITDDTTLELIAALVEREDTDEIRDRLPGNTGMFVAGLLEAMEGNDALAQSIADALPLGCKELQLLQRAIRHSRMRPSTVEGARRGLEILIPGPYDGGFDAHSDAVIGYCTSDSGTSTGTSRTAFVKPLAAIRGGRVELLSIAQKPVVFPEGGDIIAFHGARYPKQPTIGLIGAWFVARHDTDKPAKFHLDRDFSRVYEVTRIPVHGSDPDAVRGYLKELGVVQRKVAPLQPQLYALGNGLIISPRNDSSDLSKDEAYDLPLPAWACVEATILEGRTLVIGLPPPTTTYDCAPLGKTLRQLAKTIQERRITAAQLRELIEAFDDPTSGLDKIRVRRVLDQLNEIAADRSALEELIPALLEHQDVQQMIKVDIDAAVSTKVSERTDLHREIEKLSDERLSLERKIKDLTLRHRRLCSETNTIVKSAFEKAVDAGFATLAQVEIFSALTGARPTVPLAIPGEHEAVSVPIEKLTHLPEAEVLARLKTLGVGRIFAVGLLETVRIASKCGLAVCIRGTFARAVARTIACAFDGQGAAVDIGIGLIDSTVLDPLLMCFSTYNTILLLDANLSALELYARKMLDRIVEDGVACEQTTGRTILLGLSQSAMALPIPGIVSRLSIIVDCDRDFEFDSIDSTTGLVQSKKPEEVKISPEALERLRDEIGQVESVLRPVVDRIVDHSVS